MSTPDDKKIDAIDAAIANGVSAYIGTMEGPRSSVADCREAQTAAFEETLAKHGFELRKMVKRDGFALGSFVARLLAGRGNR